MAGGFYVVSATAASNTSLNSIAIQGTSSVGNFDDALRELVAEARQYVNDIGGNNTVGGTADAITLTPSAGAISAAFDGLLIGFVAGADNTTTSPTANVGSLGAEPIKKAVAGAETALAVGDIQSGGFYMLRWRSSWDSAGGAWQLIDMNAAVALVADTDYVAPDGSLIAFGDLNFVAGDIVYWSGTDTPARLAKGTAGQVLTMNTGATAPEWATPNTLTLGTTVATTSGTTKDFTSIPAGCKRITLMFNAVSLSGTDNLLVQIGDSGGVETSGYSSGSTLLNTGGSVVTSTAGFIVSAGDGGNATSGAVVLTHMGSNLWVIHGTLTGLGSNSVTAQVGGTKTLSDELDRVRFAATGSDTFDAGSVNIMYEV